MLPVLEKPPRVDTVSEFVDCHYGALQVWHQPKIDLKRMCVVCMETLARVEHPTPGVLLPGSLLPYAGASELLDATQRLLCRRNRSSTSSPVNTSPNC